MSDFESQDTVLASGTVTATTATPTQTNTSGRGVTVTINVTAASGTSPTLVAQIQGRDPISGGWYALNAAPTAITTTGLYAYQVYPGATAGGLAQATPLALPTNWRVNLVIGGTTPSFTLCVGYDYHQ